MESETGILVIQYFHHTGDHQMVPTNEVKTDNQLDTHDHPDACALGTKGYSHTDLVEKESEISRITQTHNCGIEISRRNLSRWRRRRRKLSIHSTC